MLSSDAAITSSILFRERFDVEVGVASSDARQCDAPRLLWWVRRTVQPNTVSAIHMVEV